MATAQQSLPRPDVPFLDLRTGLISREWYRFFQEIVAKTAELEARVVALEP
jgi:hypothetical protein